jgi:hypothetical protein
MEMLGTRTGNGSGERFEWAISLLSAWWVAGLFLDGWAHIHFLPESFFTPWHAMIYTGILAIAIVLGQVARRARKRGARWSAALPAGYGLSLIGVVAFLAAGGADMAWHLAFGIEADLEALYSPPHLLLAASGLLIVTGPLRAAWHRPEHGASTLWRAVLSATLFLAILAFFTSESHPITHPWAAARFRPTPLGTTAMGLPTLPLGGLGLRELIEMLGISGVIIQSAILMALVLFLLLRWGRQLPFGWLTFLLGGSALGASIFHATQWVSLPAIFTGVAADLAYRLLRPEPARPASMRLFGAGVPVVLYASYFIALSAFEGIWWPPNIWAGSLLVAGAVGLLVSYLVVTPTFPSRAAPSLRVHPTETAT